VANGDGWNTAVTVKFFQLFCVFEIFHDIWGPWREDMFHTQATIINLSDNSLYLITLSKLKG
jgi:hypothetical protein